jgi:hypothetical protein
VRYNKDMVLVGILGWWYGTGWHDRMRMVSERLARVEDFFSLGLLTRTLFAPFRQIAAGSASGSVSDKFRALVDQLFSRAVGAVVRIIMLVVGIVWLSVLTIAGVVELVLWLFVPLFPLIGAVLFAIGWVPHVGL